MSTTVAQAITRMRVRLDETTASKWADSGQLVNYISDAEQWLRNLLVKIPGSGRFRVRDTFTLSASSETFAVSGLSHRFGELIEMECLIGGVWVPLRTMEDGVADAYYRNTANTYVPVYRLMGESFQFLPISTEARSMAVVHRYKPSIKTSSSDTLETPDDYVGDLVLRALHFAMADAGLTNSKFEEENGARIAEIEYIESSRFQGANTERIRMKSTRRLFLPSR